jgi:nitroreductase
MTGPVSRDPAGDFAAVQRTIRQRRTAKVLAPADRPLPVATETWEKAERRIREALADSGLAPFHFDRKLDGLAEPWRVYWIDWRSCRSLSADLPELVPDLRPGNKLAGLLAACTSLVLFTWLPVDAGEGPMEEEKRRRVNDEHLAATAAATQNFLLLCTAAGYQTYWSSGELIERYLFGTLGISQPSRTERLLAAVFIHVEAAGDGSSDSLEIVPGAQRDRRSDNASWLRRVNYTGRS